MVELPDMNGNITVALTVLGLMVSVSSDPKLVNGVRISSGTKLDAVWMELQLKQSALLMVVRGTRGQRTKQIVNPKRCVKSHTVEERILQMMTVPLVAEPMFLNSPGEAESGTSHICGDLLGWQMVPKRFNLTSGQLLLFIIS
jgi:hypothetical protein